MKAQTGLTFFIGDILVGVVALIVALIIAWASLTPLLDACRIASGISYDIVSVVQSEFAVPGEVTLFYKPPSECEAKDNMIICNPSNSGGNPNITSLRFSLNYIGGSFGFDSAVPLSSKVSGKVYWFEKGKKYSSDVQVNGMGTLMYSSPYLNVETHDGKIEITKKEYTYGSGFYFSGEDPLVTLANKILFLERKCKNSEATSYSTIVKIEIPSKWELAWNDSHICEYNLVLNSWVYSYNQYRLVLSTSLADQINFLNKVAGFFISFVYPSSFDCSYKNKSVFLLYGEGLVFLYNSTENIPDKPYDPYNQSNVEKYSTGWKKEMCLDFSKIGKQAGIKNYRYTFDDEAQGLVIKGSDRMNHPILNYEKFNTMRLWEFNVTFNCTNNLTEIKLVSIK